MLPAFLPFSVARLPNIVFGACVLRRLPDILGRYGRQVLLVRGQHFLDGAPSWQAVLPGLIEAGFSFRELRVSEEPSPQIVDKAVADLRGEAIDVVLGIGGGSVLDTAKAVAGLLKPGNSVIDHLEGVGPELPYRGPATPFIAVPSTAGTGSEATKNAVLSIKGHYKKSFRDEKLMAEYALVDPDLLATCPKSLVAADGMDALTQLLEAFVSTGANPFTDALALSGIAAVRDGFLAWHDEDDPAGRSGMAYAALLSGICLAQAGLGAVHGMAAPLGAFFPIPHGAACGTLVAEVTKTNIDLLEETQPEHPALAKYAQLGRMFRRKNHLDDVGARVFLVHILREWTEHLTIPRLSGYGVAEADLPRIAANSRGNSMKTNPLPLSDADLISILAARL